MSDAPMPDALARERALDPGTSFIVQAPAGSGKTELLIQRFLVLLARVERPEEITAITFTRKAAAEMRRRILEALASARRDPCPAAPHKARTWALARAAVQRDDALGWALEASGARLRVQTIDALCVSLTRQMPVTARFGAQPESIDDATLLYLEAARETLALVEDKAELAADVARVLAHLDNNVVRAEKLIAELLARRDHWLRCLHGADDRGALERVLADICRAAIEQARGLFPQGYAVPAVDDRAAWLGMVQQYVTLDGTWRKRGVPPELAASDELLRALCALRELPLACYEEAQWQVLGAILRLARMAVGQLKVVFAAHGTADFTEIAQGALRALENEDGPTDLLLALDYRIRHLLVDEFQDTSYTQFELLCRLTSGWSEGDGRTLFVVGDPMQSIYRFREAEVGLFLRARRDGIGGVRLAPLTLCANFRSQGGLVDWVNRCFGRVMPAGEDIARGAVPYRPSHAVHPADGGEAVHVHAFFDGDEAGEAQAVARIARAALEDPGHDGKPATVAILVRNRSHLARILPQLRACGLRFRAVEIEPLAQRPVVQDLVALTRALSHLADRTAWLAVLRAPWCGLDLDDLWRLAAIDKAAPVDDLRPEPPTVWERLHDEATVTQLSAEGARRALRTREVLGTSLAQRRRGLLRDAVEAAWLALAGPACMASVGDIQDVEAYLAHLEAAEEGGALDDLQRFEASLQKLFAAPDAQASEQLQVMTIHKAKGLEFDTVILPGLGASGRGDERKLMVWMERPDPSGAELEFLLSPLNAAGGDADPIYEYIRRLDKEKDALEEGRLLYVAATRPRRAQHLLGDVKREVDGGGARARAPARDTLLHALWPIVEQEFARAAAAPPTHAEAASLRPAADAAWRLEERVATFAIPTGVAWTAAAVPRPAGEEIEFSWVGETARHAGSVVHRWLQRIAEEGLEAWSHERVEALRPAMRRALAARGVNEPDLEAASRRVAAALHGCLDEERGRWILGPHPGARTEYRLSMRVGGEVRSLAIDRTFRDASGRRWIVDFKTSFHEGSGRERFLDRELERYRAQLLGYAAAFPGEDVGLGLYFPLMQAWREIAAAPELGYDPNFHPA